MFAFFGRRVQLRRLEWGPGEDIEELDCADPKCALKILDEAEWNLGTSEEADSVL